ncbi:ferrochelatase [Kytococcus aerolatus]|uniref:Coproporphyrin III ferrochelatase n=1 Tax=Kytococcus aerolatus TaxID=592308 RepID=A0A212T3D9_9MICO|nr:ferrochelatase [Kytococcus aerolatus]SNC60557.1 ferrochelatase [Kytococcus aerolatus]
MTDDLLAPYDAVLLTSFGGPEGPDEVLPFLRRVTAGKDIPDERLAEVGEHYHLFGGRSPINDQCRALQSALTAELRRRGIALPVLWGNRNSEPFLDDTVAQAARDGQRRLLALTTSAYSSYSSCRQYRENLADAVTSGHEAGDPVVQIDKVRPYAHHPGFSATNSRLVTEAVRGLLTEHEAGQVALVTVTHSIPDTMDETSGPGDSDGQVYRAQHEQLTAAIEDEVQATLGVELRTDLAYCSRSGPPSVPWLEPDVNDHLRELAALGVRAVAVAPIGFVSDHMEVVYDLDVEAKQTADELGLTFVRVPTVGVAPEFVSGLVDLLEERAAEARGEGPEARQWPPSRPMPAVCAPGCCPNLRAARPALCGAADEQPDWYTAAAGGA